MRTAYLVSLKYSPVFLMICRERARVIQVQLPVTMLLSRGYQALGGAVGATRYLSTSTSAASMLLDTAILSTIRAPAVLRLFRKDPPALVLFENPHPANVVVAVLAKLACRDTLVVPVLHEPYKADKRVYGRSKSAYISAVEFCQSALIRLSGAVVVPSTTAAHVFAGRYPDFKRPVIRIPLPFERGETAEGERRYVSFLGHAVKVKGIDRFFQLVERAAELNAPYHFQIATSSNIDAYPVEFPTEHLFLVSTVPRGQSQARVTRIRRAVAPLRRAQHDRERKSAPLGRWRALFASSVSCQCQMRVSLAG